MGGPESCPFPGCFQRWKCCAFVPVGESGPWPVLTADPPSLPKKQASFSVSAPTPALRAWPSLCMAVPARVALPVHVAIPARGPPRAWPSPPRPRAPAPRGASASPASGETRSGERASLEAALRRPEFLPRWDGVGTLTRPVCSVTSPVSPPWSAAPRPLERALCPPTQQSGDLGAQAPTPWFRRWRTPREPGFYGNQKSRGWETSASASVPLRTSEGPRGRGPRAASLGPLRPPPRSGELGNP